MANEAKIRELIKKRASIKAKLTQFTAYLATLKSLDQPSDAQIAELELRTRKLDSSYSLYDEFQSELEILSEAPEEQYADRELFENQYYSQTAAARNLVSAHRKQQASETVSEVGSGDNPTTVIHHGKQSNVRLPKINLPHFSGGYQDWLEFKDIYISLIHNDRSIDEINKFHYLRATLHGSASLIIKNLDFTAENYRSAWRLLCERYDNRQLLVNNHVKSLFSVNEIQCESSHGIRNIIDVTNKNLRALQTLNQPVEHWDTLIIFIMASKLDSVTSRHWEEHRNTLTDTPSLETFIQFLRNRSNILETLEESKKSRETAHSFNKQRGQVASSSTTNISINKNISYVCPLCQKNHYIFNCDTFKALPTQTRVTKAKECKVCLNCLRPGHPIAKCKLKHCKYCNIKHNTLLHDHSHDESPMPEHVVLSASNVSYSSRHVLLSTALVKVMGLDGNQHHARVLLDNGSTANFATQNLLGKLNLPTRVVNSNIIGINNQHCCTTRSCVLQITSNTGEFKIDIDCFILPKITSVPSTTIEVQDIPLPPGVQLADPSFHIPSSIDILVGADVFWSVIGTTRIGLGKHNPVLFETKFGWLLSGGIYQPDNQKHTCMHTQDVDTSHILTRFWELDSILPRYTYTPEEYACEQSFVKTTTRNHNGRFIVSIPLKEPASVLGNSFDMAKRRFASLERRFEKDPSFKRSYVEFMQEYESLGHMTECVDLSSSLSTYYLPHHGVFRESSTTTKLRVVFDASAATSSGKSLNDIQLVGPRIQNDLFSILLRFRLHRFVVSADIEKFFRQILISENQRPLQLVLWRKDSSHTLKTYSLNTVTYGTASAPFLSTRCLLSLSKQAPDEDTRRAIADDFYVDDFLSGGNSEAETIDLCRKVGDLLASAKLQLRKWQSNNQNITRLFSHMPPASTQSDTKDTVSLSANELSKTLGLNWNCNTDNLTFSINTPQNDNKIINKRRILSTIAQVFDPLGLVSPCIVEAKLLMQKLWVDQSSWDDEVSKDIKAHWTDFTQTLTCLNLLQIPRWIATNISPQIEFHVFSDASERAYGACIYVRSVSSSGSVSVRLLSSKSKVAPLKITTIPRLELCAALLGTRLCTKVVNSVTVKQVQCIFWCDSTIVLGWINTSPTSFKPFVRNRVSEIRDGYSDCAWRYVPSKDNPADLISRGLSASLIGQSLLWWSGPSFLLSDSSMWPTMPNSERPDQLPETVKSLLLNEVIDNNTDNTLFQTMIKNSSKYTRLQRVIAYVLRFINNCRNSQNVKYNYITSVELREASYFLIRIAQKESFLVEYDILKSGHNLPTKNRLKSLSVYLDSDIIRVGGRLDNSYYGYDLRHPILLCSKHHLTKLIFNEMHLRLFHAGPQLLLATVRHTYWPLGGRNLARKVVRECVKCVRFKGATVQPIMGQLPKERVQLEFPFLETGVDYAGPILIADRKGRGCRLTKSYICIFICLATKAVHLELVSDLSKEAFIAALERFTARRGKPSTIFSDNGTTFVGASNLLREQICSEMAQQGINFSFIPAYTPHYGGLWESAVKSVKHHLRRILGLTHLTFEELTTCLTQIEAILNSRPITPLSCDPSDLQPLTPAHFLIGRSLTSLPHQTVSNYNINCLQRFQRVEYLRQHFWRRFSGEYISWLQKRTKWSSSKGELKEGTMVVVKEKNTPPLMWLLGRIDRVHPGRDGVVRVVDIKTKRGLIRRAFNTICPLPLISTLEDPSSTPGVFAHNN